MIETRVSLGGNQPIPRVSKSRIGKSSSAPASTCGTAKAGTPSLRRGSSPVQARNSARYAGSAFSNWSACWLSRAAARRCSGRRISRLPRPLDWPRRPGRRPRRPGLPRRRICGGWCFARRWRSRGGPSRFRGEYSHQTTSGRQGRGASVGKPHDIRSATRLSQRNPRVEQRASTAQDHLPAPRVEHVQLAARIGVNLKRVLGHRTNRHGWVLCTDGARTARTAARRSAMSVDDND